MWTTIITTEQRITTEKSKKPYLYFNFNEDKTGKNHTLNIFYQVYSQLEKQKRKVDDLEFLIPNAFQFCACLAL